MSRKERIENGEDGFPQEPVRKRFLVSDVTPEGLSYIHAQNKRGLCLWTDELSAWFKNFNRYNNGSEEQFWLSVFSAKTTISDRRSSKSSIFIKRPYISVIQPSKRRYLVSWRKANAPATASSIAFCSSCLTFSRKRDGVTESCPII